MKNIIMSTCLVLLVSACTKSKPDESTDLPTPIDTLTHIIDYGKSSTLKNGTPWNAVLFATYVPNNRNRFRIGGSVKQDGFNHIFSIDDITSKEGLQPIERRNLWNTNNGIPDAVYFVVLDQDQLITFYNVDSTSFIKQYVEVLHYDSSSNVVEGRFQTFLESSNAWSILPDTIKMTEGKFHLKIKE